MCLLSTLYFSWGLTIGGSVHSPPDPDSVPSTPPAEPPASPVVTVSDVDDEFDGVMVMVPTQETRPFPPVAAIINQQTPPCTGAPAVSTQYSRDMFASLLEMSECHETHSLSTPPTTSGELLPDPVDQVILPPCVSSCVYCVSMGKGCCSRCCLNVFCASTLFTR